MMGKEERELLLPSDAMSLRLGALREALEVCDSVEKVAELTILLGEAIHNGLVLGVNLQLQRPVLKLNLELAGPPWRAGFVTRID
jgi:hypothetical protein